MKKQWFLVFVSNNLGLSLITTASTCFEKFIIFTFKRDGMILIKKSILLIQVDRAIFDFFVDLISAVDLDGKKIGICF